MNNTKLDMLPELSQVRLGVIAIFTSGDAHSNEYLLRDIAMSVMGRFEVETIITPNQFLQGSVAVRKPSLLDTTQPTYAVVQGWRVQDVRSAGNFLRQQLFDILPSEQEPITLYEPDSDEDVGLSIVDSCKPMQESYAICNECNSFFEPKSKAESVSFATRIKELFRKEEKEDGKQLNRTQKKELPDLTESKEVSAIERERKKWLDALQQFTLAYVQQFHEMPPMVEIEQRVRGMMYLPSLQASTLSHIKVNGDFRIFLPEYNELELRMTPLVRTLYLFFLAHPEGIRLKDISNYVTELTQIYSLVKPGADENLARNSIESLIDPFGESLQQKLSMSRRAIREQIPTKEIAEKYTITGNPGEKYRINLPPEMIKLPNILLR